MLGSRGGYLVNVSVRGRLFWATMCGYLAYNFLHMPIRKVPEDYVLVGIFGVGLAVLCVLAFVAAMRLLWLKITLIFWH